MKKRLLSLFLVMTLVLAFGMNAFATDPAVQASYDAFGKMKNRSQPSHGRQQYHQIQQTALSNTRFHILQLSLLPKVIIAIGTIPVPYLPITLVGLLQAAVSQSTTHVLKVGVFRMVDTMVPGQWLLVPHNLLLSHHYTIPSTKA